MRPARGIEFAQAVIDELGIEKREDAPVLSVEFESELDSLTHIVVKFAVGYGLMTKIDNRLIASVKKSAP